MTFVWLTAPIAVLFKDCSELFETFLKNIDVSSEGIHSESHVEEFSEELGRLTVWNDDVQALSGDLDHRLRKNLQLRGHVVGLLQSLQNALHNGESEISGALDWPLISFADDDNLAQVETRSDVRSTRTASSSAGLSSDIGSMDTSTVNNSSLREVRGIITTLMRLAESIKDPAPQHDPRMNTEPTAAYPDLYYVENKFPKAEKTLIRRLGSAAWNRRQHLISLKSSHSLRRSSVDIVPQSDVISFSGYHSAPRSARYSTRRSSPVRDLSAIPSETVSLSLHQTSSSRARFSSQSTAQTKY